MPAHLGPSVPLREAPTGTNWKLYLLPPILPGTPFYRFNLMGYPNPAHFGKNMKARFDAPDASYGICYLGDSLDCCYLETLHDRAVRIDAPVGQIMAVSERLIRQYYAAIFTVVEPLSLAWLAGDGLALHGLDQRLTGGDDYRIPMDWSKAIHGRGPIVDGIFYAARHHSDLHSVALFDRSKHKVSHSTWGPLGDPAISDLHAELHRILTRFDVHVMPDPGGP